MVRPANQLQLSEAEMKEEHTRVLTANDPNGEALIQCRIFMLCAGRGQYAAPEPTPTVRRVVVVGHKHFWSPNLLNYTVPPASNARPPPDPPVRSVPNNISKYNYKDRMYKVDPPGPGDHLAMHLAIDGWALFREGDEAKLQATAEEKKKAAADEARKEAQKQVF